MTPIGRFFALEEFRCRCGRPDCEAPASPDPELVELLDRLRERVGAPLIVTSGLRCPARNLEEHGEPNSGHLTGTEVDLACTSSRFRWHLLRAAAFLKIPRIGVYPKHVHVGLGSPGLASEVCWLGDYVA